MGKSVGRIRKSARAWPFLRSHGGGNLAELRDPALALQNQSLEIPRTGPLVSPSPGVSLVMAAGGPTLIHPSKSHKEINGLEEVQRCSLPSGRTGPYFAIG